MARAEVRDKLQCSCGSSIDGFDHDEGKHHARLVQVPVAQRGSRGRTGRRVFDFFKGGHNDTTANTWVCVEKHKRCVAVLSNDVRSEDRFPEPVRFVLGDTGVPCDWEYGTQ